MKEKRIFPRIESDWKLFIAADKGKAQIGVIKNISLSGTLLFFFENYKLDDVKHRFTLKLTNPQMGLSELVLTGLKEWTIVRENEILLGLTLDKMVKDQKTSFIRFLSRSDNLHIEATLMEN